MADSAAPPAPPLLPPAPTLPPLAALPPAPVVPPAPPDTAPPTAAASGVDGNVQSRRHSSAPDSATRNAASTAAAAARLVAESEHLRLDGLHSHIGSQIFDISGFQVAAARVLAFRAEIMGEHGIDLTDVFLVLENEGVEKFEASWGELLDATATQLEEAK